MNEVKDCEICFHPQVSICRCIYCLKQWCPDCDRKIGKCPFCRQIIPGRRALNERNKILIYHWVFEDEEFNDVRQSQGQQEERGVRGENPWSMRNLCTFCTGIIGSGVILGCLMAIHYMSVSN